MPSLFSPLTLGSSTLPNRVFMAPLTRCRAGPGFVPTELNAQYYAQRADPRTGAGLIISEATQISQQGMGYPSTPGMYTPEQLAGWKLVTSAVHAKGGRIFAQLWHVGRISHPDFQPGGALPVAPSALNPGGECRTPDGSRKPRVTPRALTLDEIASIISDYRHAARGALDAGFDGVELHGANTYLPHQFLSSGSNHRPPTDPYGGPLENRARFMLEAAQALIDVWGPERVGVRLSPNSSGGGIDDHNPRDTFAYVVRALAALRVAYLHIMETVPTWPSVQPPIPVSFFRPMYSGVLITNAGFTLDKAQHYLREGWADAVAFGRLFIANPDLTERFRRAQHAGTEPELNPQDESTFYSPGPKGYTDYPALPPRSPAH